MTGFWKWVAAALGLVNALVILPNLIPVFHSSAVLDPAQIQHEHGAAFRVNLFTYEQPGDLLESRLVRFDLHSGLAVQEDGTPLGPSTRSLGLVRTTGRGAYAHWGPVLIFSASDNSDPRTNGHRYLVTDRLYVRDTVQTGAFSLTAVVAGVWLLWIGQAARQELVRTVRAACRSGLDSWGQTTLVRAMPLAILLGTGVAINHTFLDLTMGLPCLTGDSVSYLDWWVARTPGYPLFLWSVLAVLGDARWIVPVQLNLLLLSFAVLGQAGGSVCRSRLAGLLVALSLFGTSPLLMESYQLMSEALFISLVCAHAAAAMWLIRASSGPAAFCTGLTLALAIVVRPAGYALLAAVPVLMLALYGRPRRLQGMLLGSIGLVLVAGLAVQYARFGLVGTQSLGGISLIGHVAPVITNDLSNDYPDLTASIARRLAPRASNLQESFPLYGHWKATAESYNPLLWQYIIPEIIAYLDRTEPGLSRQAQVIRMNDVAMAIAMSAIRKRPGWYGWHMAAHYYGLWVAVSGSVYRPLPKQAVQCELHTAQMIRDNPQALPMFKIEWYAEMEQDKFMRAVGHPAEWADAFWEWLPFSIPALIAGLWWVTLLGVLAVPWVRAASVQLQSLMYLSVVIHSYMVLMAAVQVAITRYAEPVMPLLMVELVVGVWLLAGWIGTNATRLRSGLGIAAGRADARPPSARPDGREGPTA